MFQGSHESQIGLCVCVCVTATSLPLISFHSMIYFVARIKWKRRCRCGNCQFWKHFFFATAIQLLIKTQINCKLQNQIRDHLFIVLSQMNFVNVKIPIIFWIKSIRWATCVKFYRLWVFSFPFFYQQLCYSSSMLHRLHKYALTYNLQQIEISQFITRIMLCYFMWWDDECLRPSQHLRVLLCVCVCEYVFPFAFPSHFVQFKIILYSGASIRTK